jgi:hypothetical protein
VKFEKRQPQRPAPAWRELFERYALSTPTFVGERSRSDDPLPGRLRPREHLERLVLFHGQRLSAQRHHEIALRRDLRPVELHRLAQRPFAQRRVAGLRCASAW